MNQNYINEVLEIIRGNLDSKKIKERLLNYHENDIAQVFPYLSKNERLKLYKIIDKDTLSDIFSYLEEPSEYLEELSNDVAADIIENMDADDAIDLLEELDEDDRQELIELMDKEAVNDINLIFSYDDDMIGSKMTTNYISINKNATVKQAMSIMVKEAAVNDNVSTIYFTDNDGTFFGVMDLRDLIIARDGQPLIDLIKTSYPYLKATDLVSDCINQIHGYALDSIPVVGDNNRLVGVITSDDIVEVVQDELTDDYAKFAGLTEEEDLKEPIRKSIKKRLPWLLILLGLGLLTSVLISSFEVVVAAIPLIVFFQSLILDMSGNTGTQSLAVTIRVLSDDNVSKKDVRKLIFKEFKIGFLNGLLIGLGSLVAVFLFLNFFISRNQNIDYNFKIAFSVGVSMWGAMLIASLSGTIIPVVFKKFKIDPAVASGPLITTINDVIAVAVYYGLTWILFSTIIG